MEEKKHFVVATGILVKDNKFLIAKRADWEKAFPGKWTVPGGKLEPTDYLKREKDTKDLWYNVLEDLVKRELQEEVGLDVKQLDYLTSMTYVRPDGFPSIIVSMYGEYITGEIKLCKALTDYAWVDINEAKNYDLIDGIYEELQMLDNLLKTNTKSKWEKTILKS